MHKIYHFLTSLRNYDQFGPIKEKFYLEFYSIFLESWIFSSSFDKFSSKLTTISEILGACADFWGPQFDFGVFLTSRQKTCTAITGGSLISRCMFTVTTERVMKGSSQRQQHRWKQLVNSNLLLRSQTGLLPSLVNKGLFNL